MKLLTNTSDEVHIELDRTNLEILLDQLTEFPDAPGLTVTRIDGVWVKVSAVNNIGHE